MRHVLAGMAAFWGMIVLFGCGSRGPTPAAVVIEVKPGQSLQAVVEAAPAGAVIQLGRGTWAENLRLEKNVTIRGAGPENTVLQGGRPGLAVLWIGGEAQVQVEGLSIRAGRGGHVSPEISSAGVFVAQKAAVELRRVRITGNAASGIFVRDEATAVVNAAEIVENERYGVEMVGKSRVQLADCRIFQNGMGGLWVVEKAHLEGENVTVAGNKGPGLWVRDEGVVRWWDCEVRENHGPGLRLQDRAMARLLASRILRQQNAGAEVLANAVLLGYGTIFQENWYGLELKGGVVELEGCYVLSNRWDGINASGASRLSVRTSGVAGGQGSGIAASGRASVTLVANRIANFPGAGVLGFSRVPVEGEDNELEGNGVALFGNVRPALRRKKAQPSLHSLLFPDPRFPDLQSAVDALLPGGVLELMPGTYEAGITIDKALEIRARSPAVLRGTTASVPVLSLLAGASLRLVGLEVSGGAEGLALAADAAAELVDCSIWDNSTGIKLWHNSRLSAERLTVSRHAQGGIWLWDESAAVLRETTVQNNEVCGIGVGGRASLELHRSSLVENGWQGGVLLRDFAVVELWENVFRRNKGYGVAVQSSTCVGAGPGFFGVVRGGKNEFAENYKGPVCPAEFIFLAR